MFTVYSWYACLVNFLIESINQLTELKKQLEASLDPPYS